MPNTIPGLRGLVKGLDYRRDKSGPGKRSGPLAEGGINYALSLYRRMADRARKKRCVQNPHGSDQTSWILCIDSAFFILDFKYLVSFLDFLLQRSGDLLY
jgi:hypothetical protein